MGYLNECVVQIYVFSSYAIWTDILTLINLTFLISDCQCSKICSNNIVNKVLIFVQLEDRTRSVSTQSSVVI